MAGAIANMELNSPWKSSNVISVGSGVVPGGLAFSAQDIVATALAVNAGVGIKIVIVAKVAATVQSRNL